MKKDFSGAMAAGIFIGLGCFAFISAQSQTAGAVLFSLGLYGVLFTGTPLYTGRCAYALDKGTYNTPKRLAIIFFGNCLGIFILGLMSACLSANANVAAALFEAKLNKGFIETLFSSMLCGICVYTAVSAWKSLKGAERALGVMLAVPTFIIAGFEHCIADMFYFAAHIALNGFAGAATGAAFILTAALGNTIGAIAFHSLLKGFNLKTGS